MKEEVEEQSAEVNMLEQRNLEIIEEVTSSQMLGMEKTRQIYLASIGRSPSRHGGTLMKVISDESLPSMVDVAKCTAEQVKAIQLCDVLVCGCEYRPLPCFITQAMIL